MGSYNRNVVLDAIRESDGVSRVELAARTGLTPQTVSNIVRRLIADRLVIETGQVQGEMGKPRTVLRVNVEANYAVGVHIDPLAVTCVVVDLSGRVVSRVVRRPRPGSKPGTVVNHVVRGVETAIEKSGADRSVVVGVGIASPGAIDASSGEVLGPPNLPGWGRVPLRDAVADRLGLPVILDNDATAAAMGERWVGGASRAGSLAFIYLGTGIGCGLILNDQVFRGSSGNAGELGHVSIDLGGRECHCGNTGCLEAYIAPAAISAELASARGGAATDAQPDWADFARAVEEGDLRVEQAVATAEDRLADALVGLVNVLDVPRVVIGGRGLGRLAERFSAAAQDRINTRTLARDARQVEVVSSVVGESVGAIGAASLVLHSSYAPHLSVLLADVPRP
jgi:predicted NBD/HSP70 family sugar kinase